MLSTFDFALRSSFRAFPLPIKDESGPFLSWCYHLDQVFRYADDVSFLLLSRADSEEIDKEIFEYETVTGAKACHNKSVRFRFFALEANTAVD